MADILDRILHALAQAAPGIAPEAIQTTEAMLRQELGGRNGGYIAKRPTLQRAVTMGQQIRSGATIQQAINAAGCHRATAYRTLARPIKRTR